MNGTVRFQATLMEPAL